MFLALNAIGLVAAKLQWFRLVTILMTLYIKYVNIFNDMFCLIVSASPLQRRDVNTTYMELFDIVVVKVC